jgi:jumonji domain-containing protein 2
LFCEHFNKCSEHLRHKTTLINPYLVKQRYPQIQISKYNLSIECRTQHNENEFIFVFGGAYHTGFNWGFNIAEAVNYATLNWLDLMLKAKVLLFH